MGCAHCTVVLVAPVQLCYSACMATTKTPEHQIEKDHFTELLKLANPDDEGAVNAEQHGHVMDQLLRANWSELKVIESAGSLLFPDKIYRRRADGSFEGTDIKIRVPREADVRKSRIMAREIALDEKMDLDRDRALVENLETTCRLSLCILMGHPGKDPRDGSEFYEPFELDPRTLEKVYDRASLTQLWAKIDTLANIVDPRSNTIAPEEMLALMGHIAEVRHIGPLHAFGAVAQNSFIVSMASLLLTLLASKSSLAPSSSQKPAA